MPKVQVEFQRKEKTPKKVKYEIKAFTEFGNRNRKYFDMSDLMLGPSRIPVKITHEGGLVPDTFLENRRLEDSEQGQVLMGDIISTNQEFIAIADRITGFSIEGGVFSDDDYFVNEKGEALIKKGGFDFRAIAALLGEMPGSAGTEILNKEFEFKLVKLKTNQENNMNDEQLNQLTAKIGEIVESKVKMTFAELQKAEEAKNSVTLTFSKNAEPGQVAEKLKEVFGFELVEKADKVTVPEAKVEFVETPKVVAKNNTDEKRTITFETLRNNN
jgi:hypothetical protein